MNKPSIFSFLDFITFGLLSIASLVLTVIVWNSDVQLQAKALTTVVGLTFTAIYTVILYTRKKSIDAADFYTDNGWAIVNESGSTLVTADNVNAEIKRGIKLWTDAVGWDDKCESQINKHYKIVFKSGYLAETADGWKTTGQTFADKFGAFEGLVQIGVQSNITSLEQTALVHEFNHLLYFSKFGILDNDKTHAYMAEHNLP